MGGWPPPQLPSSCEREGGVVPLYSVPAADPPLSAPAGRSLRARPRAQPGVPSFPTRMMDRNYPPAPSYPDPLGSAAAAASSQPATVWAYERGVSSLKPR